MQPEYIRKKKKGRRLKGKKKKNSSLVSPSAWCVGLPLYTTDRIYPDDGSAPFGRIRKVPSDPFAVTSAGRRLWAAGKCIHVVLAKSPSHTARKKKLRRYACAYI